MICLIFLGASQLPLIGQLHAGAKLSAFEYQNKESRESRESNNHTKTLNWYLLKSYIKEIPK